MEVIQNLQVKDNGNGIWYSNSVKIETIVLKEETSNPAYIIDELFNMLLIYNNSNKMMSYYNPSNLKQKSVNEEKTHTIIEKDRKNKFYFNRNLNKGIPFIRQFHDSQFHNARTKLNDLRKALHYAK